MVGNKTNPWTFVGYKMDPPPSSDIRRIPDIRPDRRIMLARGTSSGHNEGGTLRYDEGESCNTKPSP